MKTNLDATSWRRRGIDDLKPALRSIVVGVLAGVIAGHVKGTQEPWTIGVSIGFGHFVIGRFLSWLYG